MKRSGRRGLAVAAMVLTAVIRPLAPAEAQTKQQIVWCKNSDGTFSPDQVNIGCTAIIQTGKWRGKELAVAYNSRGNAYKLKSDLDRTNGNLERAIADYDDAIRLDPNDPLFYYTRAVAYDAKGDRDHAIADYTEAIRLNPKYAGAYANRSNAYQAKGDFDRAIADDNEAIRLDPKGLFPYLIRGAAYYAKGDLDRAIADYSEVIRFNPNYAAGSGAYVGRGKAYQARGDLDNAIADYREEIRIFSKISFDHYLRGGAYFAKGDLDRAIADYSEAIRLDPKNTLADAARGAAYYAKGDLDRAISDFDDAIRLDPKNIRAYFARGRLYLETGALPKALADLNQASELNSKYAYAALWLDIANKRSNLPSRLAEAIKQIDMTQWPAPVIRLYLSQLTPEAVLAAADNAGADAKKSEICEANFYTAELDLQQGKKDDAIQLFRLAAADCPKDFVEYEGAIVELKGLGLVP
jgi:tetratricopeptide (TPR) repeat protein